MDIKDTYMQGGKLEFVGNKSREELFQLDREFREAFLDNKIPITKIIGFYLEDRDLTRNFAVRRSSNCLNNPIEISNNLSKVILENTEADISRTLYRTGDIYSDNLTFVYNAKTIEVLNKNQYLLTLLQPTAVCVILNTSTGSKTIEDNVEIMREKAKFMRDVDYEKYYPLNTLHSVAERIFILPFNGEEIRYRLEKPEDDAMFTQLWENYKKLKEV